MSVLVFPSLISIHESLGIFFLSLSLHLSQSLYHLIANVFELSCLILIQSGISSWNTEFPLSSHTLNCSEP